MAPKNLFGCWGGRRSYLTCPRFEMFGLGIVPKEKFSRLFNQIFDNESGFYLENVVIVAIGIYKERPLWQ